MFSQTLQSIYFWKSKASTAQKFDLLGAFSTGTLSNTGWMKLEISKTARNNKEFDFQIIDPGAVQSVQKRSIFDWWLPKCFRRALTIKLEQKQSFE